MTLHGRTENKTASDNIRFALWFETGYDRDMFTNVLRSCYFNIFKD